MDESRILEPIGICAVCKEKIYTWEKMIDTVVDGERLLVHNRPGCRDIWNEIGNHPRICTICGNRTKNLVHFNGGYFIVCIGECTERLKNKVKECQDLK